MATISVSGSGNVDVTVFGRGTVIAGNGNDSIDITGPGKIIVGSGHDTLTLQQGGVIREHGTSGHDTINIGAGNATIYEQGHATITGAFGSVTVSGGVVEIHQNGAGSSGSTGSTGSTGSSTSGHTQPSGSHSAPTVSGAGHQSLVGSSGHESLAGSLAHDPRQGGMERNLFATLANQYSGHLIQNFLSGDQVFHMEGHSLSYLSPHNNIISHDGNTHISIDGGMTRIELHGVMRAVDFTDKH